MVTTGSLGRKAKKKNPPTRGDSRWSVLIALSQKRNGEEFHNTPPKRNDRRMKGTRRMVRLLCRGPRPKQEMREISSPVPPIGELPGKGKKSQRKACDSIKYDFETSIPGTGVDKRGPRGGGNFEAQI